MEHTVMYFPFGVLLCSPHTSDMFHLTWFVRNKNLLDKVLHGNENKIYNNNEECNIQMAI